jgi:hypothetical protein
MTRLDPQIKLRLSQTVKHELETAAERNMRSLNAEVLSRLQSSLEREQHEAVPDFLTPNVIQTIYDIKTQVAALMAKLGAK